MPLTGRSRTAAISTTCTYGAGSSPYGPGIAYGSGCGFGGQASYEVQFLLHHTGPGTGVEAYQWEVWALFHVSGGTGMGVTAQSDSYFYAPGSWDFGLFPGGPPQPGPGPGADPYANWAAGTFNAALELVEVAGGGAILWEQLAAFSWEATVSGSLDWGYAVFTASASNSGGTTYPEGSRPAFANFEIRMTANSSSAGDPGVERSVYCDVSVSCPGISYSGGGGSLTIPFNGTGTAEWTSSSLRVTATEDTSPTGSAGGGINVGGYPGGGSDGIPVGASVASVTLQPDWAIQLCLAGMSYGSADEIPVGVWHRHDYKVPHDPPIFGVYDDHAEAVGSGDGEYSEGPFSYQAVVFWHGFWNTGDDQAHRRLLFDFNQGHAGEIQTGDHIWTDEAWADGARLSAGDNFRDGWFKNWCWNAGPQFEAFRLKVADTHRFRLFDPSTWTVEGGWDAPVLDGGAVKIVAPASASPEDPRFVFTGKTLQHWGYRYLRLRWKADVDNARLNFRLSAGRTSETYFWFLQASVPADTWVVSDLDMTRPDQIITSAFLTTLQSPLHPMQSAGKRVSFQMVEEATYHLEYLEGYHVDDATHTGVRIIGPVEAQLLSENLRGLYPDTVPDGANCKEDPPAGIPAWFATSVDPAPDIRPKATLLARLVVNGAWGLEIGGYDTNMHPVRTDTVGFWVPRFKLAYNDDGADVDTGITVDDSHTNADLAAEATAGVAWFPQDQWVDPVLPEGYPAPGPGEKIFWAVRRESVFFGYYGMGDVEGIGCGPYGSGGSYGYGGYGYDSAGYAVGLVYRGHKVFNGEWMGLLHKRGKTVGGAVTTIADRTTGATLASVTADDDGYARANLHFGLTRPYSAAPRGAPVDESSPATCADKQLWVDAGGADGLSYPSALGEALNSHWINDGDTGPRDSGGYLLTRDRSRRFRIPIVNGYPTWLDLSLQQSDRSPDNYTDALNRFHRVSIDEDGQIVYRRVDYNTPGGVAWVAETKLGEGTEPALTWNDHDLQLRVGVLYVRGGDTYIRQSDDDGGTWEEEALLIPGGTHPRAHTSLFTGERLIAAYVAGGIQGMFRGPGDTVNIGPLTFVDETATPLAVEDDSFGLTKGREPGTGLTRWELSCVILGESEVSEWISDYEPDPTDTTMPFERVT